ncbi:hypothetical protein, partial [Stenotrophomonas maltophilia]|uniref:hypothetical protein n=1 Tax=Stenotrophomonas maltophilia TaxID=40324 RepID=UPI001952BC4C
LQARGYLAQDPDSARYRLGDRIRQLAAQIAGPPLATVVQPLLTQLSGALNETSAFYLRVGDAMETIASAVGQQ